MEKTLIILKPDAVQRGVVGEILYRFERKGLKITGAKLQILSDAILDEHYAHHKGKPFFQQLKNFMKSSPCLLIILEGNQAVEVARKMAGPTHGIEALPGTIRGDYSLSTQHNIIHASDSPKTAEKEIERFFTPSEIFPYQRIDWEMIYAEDER